MAIALPRHHPYNIKICIRAKQINMPFTVVSTSNCLFIISPLMSIDVFNSTTWTEVDCQLETNLSHGLQYPPHQPSYHSCPCLWRISFSKQNSIIICVHISWHEIKFHCFSWNSIIQALSWYHLIMKVNQRNAISFHSTISMRTINNGYFRLCILILFNHAG